MTHGPAPGALLPALDTATYLPVASVGFLSACSNSNQPPLSHRAAPPCALEGPLACGAGCSAWRGAQSASHRCSQGCGY